MKPGDGNNIVLELDRFREVATVRQAASIGQGLGVEGSDQLRTDIKALMEVTDTVEDSGAIKERLNPYPGFDITEQNVELVISNLEVLVESRGVMGWIYRCVGYKRVARKILTSLEPETSQSE